MTESVKVLVPKFTPVSFFSFFCFSSFLLMSVCLHNSAQNVKSPLKCVNTST